MNKFLILLLFACHIFNANAIEKDVAETSKTRVAPLRSSSVSNYAQKIVVSSLKELKSFVEQYQSEKNSSWTLVQLKKGHYTIQDTDKKYFSLRKASNLVIDFNNSQIVFKKPAGLAQLVKCNNIIIKNAVIDFDPIPYTQGYVDAVDHKKKQVRVTVKKGWPIPDNRFRKMGKNWMLIKDAQIVGRQKRGCQNVYTINKDWQSVGENAYVVNFITRTTNIEVGDKVVHLGPGGGNCFSLNDTHQITLENITQYAGGVFVGAQRANATNLISCKVTIKPETDRWHSLTRDIMIERDARIGPWIENCIFEANGDDGINLHTKGFKIIKRLSDFELLVGPEMNQFKRLNAVYLNRNDSIVIFDNKLGRKYFEAAISELTSNEKGCYTVRFKKKLPEFPNIEEKYPNIDSRYEAWNTAVICPGFVIQNNTFKHQRRFGLLTLSKNGIIEGNKFIGSSANAIYMGFLEELSDIGQMSGNIYIRNNIFDDCFLQDKRPSTKMQASAINITLPKRPDKSQSPYSFFQNIVIANNSFKNFKQPFPIVRVHNTNESKVENNRFSNCFENGNYIETKAGNVKVLNNVKE
ncbi:right-handed parallel beta-helix repeat-containing protein [Prolixibacteraceae bacterium JC049]|nr:right-handed parallel beta-helix repeat-containing protein [Prolixibacteraceae bacterium JC049]